MLQSPRVTVTAAACIAQMWVAPELLRLTEGKVDRSAVFGSREGDVYSFGVIMQEIATSDEPYCAHNIDLEGLFVVAVFVIYRYHHHHHHHHILY